MRPNNIRFFGSWAILLIVGVLLLKFGSGAWPALGMLIFGPMVIAILLMGWGYLVWQIIKLFGDDPAGESVGTWVFVSFAFFVLPLLIAILTHHGR